MQKARLMNILHNRYRVTVQNFVSASWFQECLTTIQNRLTLRRNG